MNKQIKPCQSCKTDFTVEPEDFAFYKKMNVPVPLVCPDCRFKRRSVFRNERTLYRGTCDLCKRSVITMYNPKSPYLVYCNDCWSSDKWDPFSYAEEYNPRKPFFEQLGELIRKVPKSATYSIADLGPNVNSEYVNFGGSNKDCYLLFNSGPRNENCAYGRGLSNNRDVFDTYYADGSERIYEGVNVQKSSGAVWCQNIAECLDSWYLLNCSGCQNCFGCVNERYKSYHFFNEPLSKEKWKQRVTEIIGSYERMEKARKQFEEHSLKFPRRENNNLKSVRCVGDYIFESKNCFSCFEASFCENTNYSFSVKNSKDCYDLLGHGRKGELLLEGVAVGSSSRVIGSWWVATSQDIGYSFAVRSSEHCFGCDGLRNAKYCILNKRYSEEEYGKLRNRIIEELKGKNLYGIFMPPDLALFAYNEAIGQDNLPLTKEEALAEGFRWEEDIQMTRGQETLKSAQIPDHINDVPDSIIDEILVCVSCGRNYRIIKPELAFYRKMILPLPRQCFNCRHVSQLARRGPFKLFDRTCARCGKAIKTNYAPDRKEIVYCEQCYRAEVI